MCGIAGWIDWRKDLRQEAALLERMTAALAPRGPDDAGLRLERHAALGHRRLVVVDPDGGRQPMTRRFGGRELTIVYNGELYNTEDLRRPLLAKGYRFKGHSDTEVLLAAFAQWGEDCLGRLNGIFAFAIWDARQEELFLARDRLGVKPLFYAERPDAFLFGSELKALLAHPLVPPELDRDGLAEIFLMAPSRTPGHGVFRGVKELRPGRYLRFGRSGLRERRFWSLESYEHPDDLDTTVRTVRELLQDTVERQLVSDVGVSALLSGGLDSSAVSAFASVALAREGRGPLRTWAVQFDDQAKHFRPTDFQTSLDGPWAAKVATYLGTDHHTVTLGANAVASSLEAATIARDLPGMADVDSSLLLFCREIKEGSTVALSGESADEVFGGYPWFVRPDALAADTFPWALRQRDRVALLDPDLVRYLDADAYVAQRYREALDEVPRLRGEDPAEARMREILHLNITRFLPTLLDRKDRMSMATGLEVRVPFCDHRLVQYVFNIPWSMKMLRGQRKGILREALRGVLPQDVVDRPKSPYPSTPDPRFLQAVRKGALEVLHDPRSPLAGYLNVPAIEALARADQDPFALPWFSQLMGLPQWFAYVLQLDTFLRHGPVTTPYRGRSRIPDLPETGAESAD